MLRSLKKFRWSVIEQEQYVDLGNEQIADEYLKFYSTIKDFLNKHNADVLLLSCVLQYLKTPYEMLNDLLSHKFKYVVIDRVSLIDDRPGRLTIQTVPSHIYNASYPAWFFNTDDFEKFIRARYRIIERYKSDIIDTAMLDDETNAYWQGYILERIDE